MREFGHWLLELSPYHLSFWLQRFLRQEVKFNPIIEFRLESLGKLPFFLGWSSKVMVASVAPWPRGLPENSWILLLNFFFNLPFHLLLYELVFLVLNRPPVLSHEASENLGFELLIDLKDPFFAVAVVICGALVLKDLFTLLVHYTILTANNGILLQKLEPWRLRHDGVWPIKLSLLHVHLVVHPVKSGDEVCQLLINLILNFEPHKFKPPIFGALGAGVRANFETFRCLVT